jgi:hypothetical protein
MYGTTTCKYFKADESTKTNPNSITAEAAKFVKEPNQSDNSDKTKEGIQHTKATLGESL